MNQEKKAQMIQIRDERRDITVDLMEVNCKLSDENLVSGISNLYLNSKKTVLLRVDKGFQ